MYITWIGDTKSFWLQSNPVTAVCQFQHRFQALHKFILSKAYPLGIVTDFVEKVEFQARGSPHSLHILGKKSTSVTF